MKILVIILFCIFLSGCERSIPGKLEEHIVVIDSCEYLVNGFSSANNYSITHKGNCKYCRERRLKEKE